LGYGSKSFYAFAYCQFSLVDVDYARMGFVLSYSYEVYVVCEDHGLPLDGCLDLLLVCLGQFADVFG
jgi:hypothetical protein